MTSPIVVITGATEGIGRGLAEALAARGARLVLAARTAEKLEEARAACEAAGAEVLTVPMDVSDAGACASLIQRAVERFGSLDVLINNAGISMHGRFDEVTSLDMFQKLMAVNYLGAVYCTHAALPHLKRSRGLIASISSLQGKTGFPGSTGYAASKHAMQGFFDSLRMELEGTGVGVLVVSPGPVATAIHHRRLGTDGQRLAREDSRPNSGGMSVETCVRLILRAMDRRDREVVMTGGGKLAVLLKPFFPGFVDRQVSRAVAAFYSRRGRDEGVLNSLPFT